MNVNFLGEALGAIDEHRPDVVLTDIRMPPSFQQEGIDAAREIRKQHPGTGIVILSQFDDPEYAISLLDEGAAGYAYLLKDRVAEGDQLAWADVLLHTGVVAPSGDRGRGANRCAIEKPHRQN